MSMHRVARIAVLWDLDTQTQMDFDHFQNIWVYASPGTWNGTGNAQDTDNPADRLLSGAAHYGWDDDWLGWSIGNGTHH